MQEERQAKRDIEGVYVANVTPFQEESLEIDVDAYLAHVRWLGEMGVTGVVPFGTNGEGPSVTLNEKLRVLVKLFETEPRVQVIPTVMQGNLPETLEMIDALNDHPATAVLILPPYYFKPVSVEGLLRFYEPVIEASRHPVIVYHIPKYAIPVPAKMVGALSVWGVKDSGGEHGYAEAVLEHGKDVLIGTEDDLYARLNSGARGAISALANFMPEEIVEMHRLVKSGDDSRGGALSDKLNKVRTMTKEYASPAVLKRLAATRHGIPMGTVRPPFVPLPAGYDPDPVLKSVAAY